MAYFNFRSSSFTIFTSLLTFSYTGSIIAANRVTAQPEVCGMCCRAKGCVQCVQCTSTDSNSIVQCAWCDYRNVYSL